MKSSFRNLELGFSLPLALGGLAIASVAFAIVLQESMSRVENAQLQSKQTLLSAQNASAFTKAKEIMFDLIAEEVELSPVRDSPTYPDDLILLGGTGSPSRGVLPDDLTTLVDQSTFDRRVHGIMQHEKWNQLSWASDEQMANLRTRVELRCVGEKASSGFQSGVCTRATSRYPKVFEMYLSVSDIESGGLQTNITARLEIKPQKLNAFSMLLSNADTMVFGDGYIKGAVSINLASSQNIIFMNQSSLVFDGLFQVSDIGDMYFGRVPSDPDPFPGYELPTFNYGYRQGFFHADQTRTHFNSLQTNIDYNQVDITPPANPNVAGIILPDEVFHSADQVSIDARFGQSGSDCVAEVDGNYDVVFRNPVIASGISCTGSTCDSAPPAGHTCTCSGGVAIVERGVSHTENLVAQGVLPDNSVIWSNSPTADIYVDSLTSSGDQITFCGDRITLVNANEDIVFRRSFIQEGLVPGVDTVSDVNAAFVVLADDKHVVLEGPTRLLDASSGAQTITEVYNNSVDQYLEDELSFRIDGAIGALGANGSFKILDEFLALPDAEPHRQFGQIQLNGSMVAEKAPNLRQMLSTGTTRVGFGTVARNYNFPASPGFDISIETALEIQVTNVSVSEFRIEDAFNLVGVSSPTTLP